MSEDKEIVALRAALQELRTASQAVADAWEAKDGLIRSVGEAMKPLRAVLARLDGEEGAG